MTGPLENTVMADKGKTMWLQTTTTTCRFTKTTTGMQRHCTKGNHYLNIHFFKKQVLDVCLGVDMLVLIL